MEEIPWNWSLPLAGAPMAYRANTEPPDKHFFPSLAPLDNAASLLPPVKCLPQSELHSAYELLALITPSERESNFNRNRNEHLQLHMLSSGPATTDQQ